MINLPARRNPQQHLADPVPKDSGGLSTDNPNTGSFPWATSASQDAISECIDFDSQFNSELLVRAAAAAYNCRSSYIGTRSREQSQQQQQLHRPQSKAKTCDVIVDYQSQTGHSSSTFWPDSLSSYRSSPVSVPETEISEVTLFSSVDDDEKLGTNNQDVSQAHINDMLLTSALDECSFNSKLLEKFDDSTTLVMTEPPLVEVPVAFAIGESIPRVAPLTPLNPVIPLRIVRPLEYKSTKRHRPPPFDLRSSSPAHSQKSSQTPALNQPMAKSFVRMMSAKLDAQANKATEAIQQGNVTEDNRGTENLSLKKGRHFWTRSSLLPKRKSGNKVDLIPEPSAANSVVQCIPPLGVPHYLKGTTDQSDSLLSPETIKFVDGNTKTTTATISAKTRRHMQSKSQDYTGGLPQDITWSLGIPHGKTIRRVRSGTALNSSAKTISMPLLEQPSSSILRSNVRGAVSKVSSPSTDTFPKAMAGWSTLLWRNPFQPSSPSQESSEGNELPKQRYPLEEPASPVSPSLPIHLGLRRKKSMYEKLLGKWSKKLPSLTSPLSSPRFPSGISNSDSSSGNLDLSYFERQSTSYFSAFGSPVTSPTFQNDENGMFKLHESLGCKIYLPNETHDSDDDDMSSSASQIQKKGKNNNKAKIPLGESRTKELYQQDEVLKRMADLATDDSYIRKRSEDSCSRSRFEALWIDEDDYDGDDGDEYYEYHDGYFGGSDEEFFDFETGGYESKILRKPGRESRSEAYIQRVMEQWQVWSVAHAAIY
ncbi:hypothetical protein BGZ49_003477 [Haplosporangium sp. Z 27]|nr:hypothetical protein BGZ49_003477 [Haplosporangium sp. Z 27]